MLTGIDDLPSHSLEIHSRVEDLEKRVMHHVRDEEEKLFPRIRQASSPDELRELGEKLARMKETERDKVH
jgi:hemerythrin superfamily protein